MPVTYYHILHSVYTIYVLRYPVPMCLNIPLTIYRIMKEREETGLFLKRYTDDDFIDALNKALEIPTATALEVSELLGCNSRYAVNRLNELADNGKIDAVMKGRTWGFRPKKKE